MEVFCSLTCKGCQKYAFTFFGATGRIIIIIIIIIKKPRPSPFWCFARNGNRATCVNFSALLIIRLQVQSDKIALQVCPSSMILGITIHYITVQEAGVSGIKQNVGFGCMNGDGIRVHQ